MPLLTLPARHEMQEVVALVRAAVFLTGLARELDGAAHEEGSARGGVEHLDQARVAGKKQRIQSIRVRGMRQCSADWDTHGHCK